MGDKRPKTGTARRMRAWMRSADRTWTVPELIDGLGLSGRDRDRVRTALRDFIQRGEILREADGRYRYRAGWRRKPAIPPEKRRKICRAMLVSGRFTSRDVQRLAGTEAAPIEIGYVQKICRELAAAGHLRVVGRRPAGRGRERVFALTDRDRFRREAVL